MKMLVWKATYLVGMHNPTPFGGARPWTGFVKSITTLRMLPKYCQYRRVATKIVRPLW